MSTWNLKAALEGLTVITLSQDDRDLAEEMIRAFDELQAVTAAPTVAKSIQRLRKQHVNITPAAFNAANTVVKQILETP